MDFVLGKAASILGPAIELKNCIYEPVKREVDYIWCYDDNVKNVKDEARKLEDKIIGLQMRVEEAENNARVVLPEVKSWFKEVTEIQAKMDEIETEIATIQNGGFSQSFHRRSLSKKVKMIAEAMKDLSTLKEDPAFIEGRPGLHADSRVFPNLHLLWIDCYRDEELNINDCFFKGMKNLNVLSINNCQLTWLPETTLLLKNLQTLVLESFESLKSISVIGELVNLKILICRKCDSIESLPMEIGRLRELSDCQRLETIPPGIISKLKELEELIVWKCFDGWEAKNMGKESKNALLSELDHLSSLSRLKIAIKDSKLAAAQIRLSTNLTEYHIRIGDLPVIDQLFLSHKYKLYERIMELMLPENISPGEWIRELVRSVEYMYIVGDGSSLDFGVAGNMHIKGDGSGLDFAVADKMRVLNFKNCSTVKTLVSTVFPLLKKLQLENLVALKEICDINGPMSSNSFNNLQHLSLEYLPALEGLNIVSTFSRLSSVYVCDCNKLSSMMIRGSSLVQLESLVIQFCEMMEQVLLWGEEEDQIYSKI